MNAASTMRDVQKDSDALVVEAVTDAGDITVRFFGGARLALHASPERARMLRRLIPGSDSRAMMGAALSPSKHGCKINTLRR